MLQRSAIDQARQKTSGRYWGRVNIHLEMSVNKWIGVFGDLAGRIDSGHEVNQMFTEAEGSGQGPWGGRGKRPESVCNSEVRHLLATQPPSQFLRH